MRIHRLVVSPWQANCYFVQPDDASPEVAVVDPGVQGAEAIEAQLEEIQLTPVALLGTHGHVDHVGDAHLLAARHEVPLHLAAEDRPLLTRPGLALGPNASKFLPRMLGGTDELPAPQEVIDLREEQEIGGLRVRVLATPGHTKGSVVLDVAAGEQHVLFSGDVVFAGSIGRTDFPGGSMDEMRASLRRILDTFDHELLVLPGHGQETSLAAEVSGNPYLSDDFLKVE